MVVRAAGGKRESLGAASGEGESARCMERSCKAEATMPGRRGQDISFLTLVLLSPLKTAAQGPNLAVHFVSAAGKRRFLLHAHNHLQELGGSPAVLSSAKAVAQSELSQVQVKGRPLTLAPLAAAVKLCYFPGKMEFSV